MLSPFFGYIPNIYSLDLRCLRQSSRRETNSWISLICFKDAGNEWCLRWFKAKLIAFNSGPLNHFSNIHTSMRQSQGPGAKSSPLQIFIQPAFQFGFTANFGPTSCAPHQKNQETVFHTVLCDTAVYNLTD